MAQRLKVKTSDLKEVVKKLSSFYTPSKLYDYSNFVTIEVVEGMLCFDMCIIVGEATNNALVTTWFDLGGVDEDIPPMALNFQQLSNFIKIVKSPTIEFVMENKSISLIAGNSIHVFESSTVRIPTKIVNSMSEMRTSEVKELDFSGKKVYNNIRTTGDFLTMNTLNFSLYGIMATPQGTFATNGFVLSRYVDDTFKDIEGSIFFPAYLKPILKSLENESFKMKVRDRLVYLKGKDFEFYFEEWMNKKDYPITKLETILSNSLTPIEEDTQVFMNALSEISTFTEVITIDFKSGIITNKEGTHTISIKAQSNLDTLNFHADLVPKDSITWDSIEVDTATPRIKFISSSLTKLAMGMTRGTD